MLLLRPRLSAALAASPSLSIRHLHRSQVRDDKKAVIFDMGGVILPSPFAAAYRKYDSSFLLNKELQACLQDNLSEWEASNSFEKGSIFSAVRRGGGQGAWARLERGELTLEQFYEPFAAEVAATTAAPVTADTVRDFMAALVRGLGTTDPEMMEAVTRLKAAGYKVAVLTNNWRSERTGRLMLGAEESAVFDAVVESCVVRMRKPEEEIYRHTLARLGVAAEEAVFLDDIAGNLRPAEQLGLAVVRVRDATSALAELQQLLGLDLGVTAGTARIRPGMEIDQARLQHYLQHKLQLSGTSTQYQVPGTSSPLQAS